MRHNKLIAPILSLSMILGAAGSVQACTEIYIGSNQTSNGHIIAGRSEDYDMAYPKTFDVYPVGAHKEGEEYQGCYGFTWTFTHDSYSYSAFSDDVSDGICPNCGGNHSHTPFQAAGTNEKGLSMTATETLYCNEEALDADPFPENSIDEAEITTILLSEADSARNALDLLISIIEDGGSANASGILFIDREETWYFENFTGTQYLAVRLNPDIVMVNPNLSVLGRIDLDDAEHVIASDQLIETAVEAGTFVGDAKENVIEFASSFEESKVESDFSSLCVALNFLTGSDDYPSKKEDMLWDRSAYTITNVDENGNIVPLHSNISLARKFDLEQSLKFYQQSPIAKPENTETHIFDVNEADKTASGLVEWISLANDRFNVFIPFYPLLTTEVSPMLSVGQGQPLIYDEQPDTPFYSTNGELYFSYPKQWDQTMYWPYEYLSHICSDDEEAAAAVRKQLDDLQAEVMVDWENMQKDVESAGDDEATADSSATTAATSAATADSLKITEKVYTKTLAICEEYYDDAKAAQTKSGT